MVSVAASGADFEAVVKEAHTPGPWVIEPRVDKYYGTNVLTADGKYVCEVWTHSVETRPISSREFQNYGPFTEEELDEWTCDSHYETARDYANARLIAAAPEMLAALIETLPQALGCFANHYGDNPEGGPLPKHIEMIRAAIAKATGANHEPL